MTDGRRTALITAFEPFGGREKNAAEEALRRLAGQVGETFPLRLEQRVLPVEADAAAQQLCAAIDEVQPAYVVCLGEATRGEICLGGWLQRAPLPHADNAGRQFDATRSVRMGRKLYRHLPLDAMLGDVQRASRAPVGRRRSLPVQRGALYLPSTIAQRVCPCVPVLFTSRGCRA